MQLEGNIVVVDLNKNFSTGSDLIDGRFAVVAKVGNKEIAAAVNGKGTAFYKVDDVRVCGNFFFDGRFRFIL